MKKLAYIYLFFILFTFTENGTCQSDEEIITVEDAYVFINENLYRCGIKFNAPKADYKGSFNYSTTVDSSFKNEIIISRDMKLWKGDSLKVHIISDITIYADNLSEIEFLEDNLRYQDNGKKLYVIALLGNDCIKETEIHKVTEGMAIDSTITKNQSYIYLYLSNSDISERIFKAFKFIFDEVAENKYKF